MPSQLIDIVSSGTISLFLCLNNISLCFAGGSVIKKPPTNAGDESLTPGSESSFGEGNGNPLQYSCLGITWTGKTGRLPSMGLQRVGRDLKTKQQ